MKIINRNTLITIDDMRWVRPLVLKISQIFFRVGQKKRLTVILRTEPCEQSIDEAVDLDIDSRVELDKSLKTWDSDLETYVGEFNVDFIEVAQDPQRENFSVSHVDFNLRHARNPSVRSA